MSIETVVRQAWSALAIAVLATLPALADPAKLAVGDAFPTVEADSVSGTHVVLRSDGHGAPFVAIFGFSQKAGEASAQWSHALYKALPPGVEIYAVADLSHVPGLFRGFAVSGIRKEAAPTRPEHRDHVLLLTRANPWSHIVPSGSDDDAVIVAVDKSGLVIDIERRAFSDAAAGDIAKAVTQSAVHEFDRSPHRQVDFPTSAARFGLTACALRNAVGTACIAALAARSVAGSFSEARTAVTVCMSAPKMIPVTRPGS
jgi:hypothetical protein